MKYKETFFIKTIKKYQILDITDKVKAVIKNSKIKNGEGRVRAYHTTTTLILNENEDGLLKDIRNTLEAIMEMIKKGFPCFLFLGFNHDDMKKRKKKNPALPRDECENADAHLLALLVGSYEISFEVLNHEIVLGTWQRILFIELDEKPSSYKERKIGVRIIPDQEEIKKEVCACGGHK